VFNQLGKKLCMVAAASAALAIGTFGRADVNSLQKDFEHPPDDARIMMRWWWYGPAVTKDGIDRELNAMKAGNVGGFEVQPTYPLVVDGPGPDGAKNLKFMSPEFLEMLGHTAAKAKELGLRMDLTLGSGWPYGGPMFTPADGAKALTTQVVQVAPGEHTATTNSRTAFAAFAGPASPAPAAGAEDAAAARGGARGRGGRGGRGGAMGDLSAFKEVPLENGVATLPADFNGGQVIFFDYRQNIMAVKRPAYGADGPVIDHLSAKTVDKFIQLVGEPELKACGPNPPFSFFCDSLEINGENWTEDFLAEFKALRGYDLKPYLPALVGSIGERTADIRHDYGQTVTDLFNKNFNAKFSALAKKYNTRFRIQGYGSPAAALYSYAFADLPEGEAGGNGNWRSFRDTRYATSAAHLLNQRLASSETFTWLHQAPFRAVPQDIKGEADTQFLEGISQIDCHGWGYTPIGLPYPGGSFYAAAVFNEKNPWYVAMPEISGYMQRISQMLREGTPANDVALYANDADVWSSAGQGFSSMNSAFTGQTSMLNTVLSAGFNLDLWDDGMLALKGKVEGGKLVFGNVKYPIVVINGAQNMPLETAKKLEEFAKGGGILALIGNPPAHVPGFKATPADQQELQAIMARLFTAPGAAGIVTTEADFWQVIGKKLAPDTVFEPASNALGAVHRHTDDAELYFVANTSAQKQSVKLTVRQSGMQPEIWDPLSAKVRPLAITSKTDSTTTVSLDLDPLGSTVVVFTKRQLPAAPPQPNIAAVDLSGGWNVKFASGPGGSGKDVTMPQLVSWTELPDMTNYSGVATYEKTFNATADMAKASMIVDFGDPTPAQGGGRGSGYTAPITSPVRDAAVVYINGKRAGAAWCAPYQVDVSGLLKEGQNTIRIDVGNTAVNYLAKAGFPNYDQRAVDAQFPPGNRFQPQNSQLLAQPLPSGLLGPIKLEPSAK
jgi:hypothetical protein